MNWKSIINTLIGIIKILTSNGDLIEVLDGLLDTFGGLAGFAEEFGISVDDVIDYVEGQLGGNSEDSAEKASLGRRSKRSLTKKATVMCPNCREFVVVTDGNGTYPCDECGEDFEVGVFDGAFTPQDDNDSSGWAVAEWLVKSFDISAPSSEKLRAILEDSHEEGDVSAPSVLSETMRALGLDPWVPDNENDKRTVFRSGNKFANWIFENDGRIAVCFQHGERGLGRHWIGLELHDGEVRVMDPVQADGYWPLARWRRGVKIGRIVAVYGFMD